MTLEGGPAWSCLSLYREADSLKYAYKSVTAVISFIILKLEGDVRK